MIKKVALIGIGAIGSYFIWGLDNKVTVIAREPRKTRYLKDGVYINDQHYDLDVKTPEEAGIQDLILISTKYDGLVDACGMLKDLVGENTIVLSLLNGIDSESIVSQYIDPKHIVYSLMRIASKREGNRTNFILPAAGLYFGVTNGNEKQIEELDSFFKDTTVHYHIVDNIVEDMWTKYATNIVYNLPQAVLQTPAKLYTDSVHGNFIVEHLWNEVYQVACANGIHLSKEPIVFKSVSKASKYSTLQDIEAKRHTEIDMFLGVLIQQAKSFNIPVPYSEYTYHLIKAIEEKNDGVFDLTKEDYLVQ